jgi:hypothetical protein
MFTLADFAGNPLTRKYAEARAALKNGLKLEQQLGVNPIKFGMIGSTDSHSAVSTVEEESYVTKQLTKPSAALLSLITSMSAIRKEVFIYFSVKAPCLDIY